MHEPLTSCSTCDAPVERVFHPVAVHFKGSGFYTTDYGRKKAGAGSSDDSSSSGSESKKSDSKSSDSKSSDSKAKTKAD